MSLLNFGIGVIAAGKVVSDAGVLSSHDFEEAVKLHHA